MLSGLLEFRTASPPRRVAELEVCPRRDQGLFDRVHVYDVQGGERVKQELAFDRHGYDATTHAACVTARAFVRVSVSISVFVHVRACWCVYAWMCTSVCCTCEPLSQPARRRVHPILRATDTGRRSGRRWL